MEKICCMYYVLFYYLKIFVKFVIIAAPLIIAFFTIDFIIWNKTKKSFWHKIKRTIKKLIEEA